MFLRGCGESHLLCRRLATHVNSIVPEQIVRSLHKIHNIRSEIPTTKVMIGTERSLGALLVQRGMLWAVMWIAFTRCMEVSFQCISYMRA